MKLKWLTLAAMVAAAWASIFVAGIVVLEREVVRHPHAASSARHDGGTIATPAMTMSEEVLLPSIAFSLAAIVRRQKPGEEPQRDQYALVHDHPPRGWWLPGGGIEHRDATPVAAAIRETVEEAGAPALLSSLSASLSASISQEDRSALPSMTHLLRLEQSPGRVRFIFRGELRDDGDPTTTPQSADGLLKRAPGDAESIEAKWWTWDELRHFEGRKRRERTQLYLQQKGKPAGEPVADPWLRGREPLTFYGMLERARRENEAVPGLPVRTMTLSGKKNDDPQEVEVTGSFFGRAKNNSTTVNRSQGLTHHGRAALLTHLKCRLLMYDMNRNTIAVDAATMALPSAVVHYQHNTTLKQLVDRMIDDFIVLPQAWGGYNETQHHIGILRVEYVIHGNGREATLTVFPCVRFPAAAGAWRGAARSSTAAWVAADDVSDGVERRLAGRALSDGEGTHADCGLDMLR